MAIRGVNLEGKRTRGLGKGVHVDALITEDTCSAGGGHRAELERIRHHVVEGLLSDDVLQSVVVAVT